MSQRIIEANRLRYTLAMEDAVLAAQRFRAAVLARVVDELTGRPPRVPIRVTTPATGLSPRASAGGLIGLLGVAFDAFPALAAQPYTAALEIRAERYIPRVVEVDVAQDAQFPERFVAADAGDIPLHRAPVTISGRVTERLGGLTGIVAPVPGADVGVAEVWPVLPPADGSVPAEPPNLASLRPPLHFARSPATGRLRRRALAPVLGQDKEIVKPAEPGSDRIRLSDWVGLAAGDVLLLDTDPAIQEYVTIDAIDPVGAEALPADITLTHALAFRHREGSRAREATPQAPGDSRELSRDAIPGDTCVFLDSLADLAAAGVVEVFGGGPPREFHELGRFSTVTDAEGRFRLPPLSRVAQLTMEAAEGGRDTEATVVPDYSRIENRLELGL